ncbi:HalOD1 output domain-containing protein [Halobaculum halobium]|uniref:HalOD1 output domain-containing protein n=1 Tax=Halobaculum halobium TaxID=3032281 RepID=A0ABD5T5J5_9EURY|nr:HalOD1 output domain-containing protein [Halobaculum sp. SYNS20]
MSEQVLLLLERLDVDSEDQLSSLYDSVDPDALNALTSTGTTTVSFELWRHWVRVTPDVIEVYTPPRP